MAKNPSKASSKSPAPAASGFVTDEGNGGETHQHVDADADHGSASSHLTTNQGIRVSDNQNSLKAGQRGPALLEDFILREKIFHFDHERIPERIVHARGSAAHGVFECTRAIPELTMAAPFQEVGKQTPVFSRFSTVAGGAGSVDTPRDVRGFAVKFYTEVGNWDLVGNNIPVFFIQDAIKFPDLIHAVKMEADRGYPQAASAHDTFWDFVGLMPETMHMIMWAMSDRTLPRSLRTMEGFGVNTFRLVNAAGEARLVKFHWRPVQGAQSTTWDEAVKIAGADPDFHRRDLFEAIEGGQYPQWDFGIQVIDEALAESLPYDILDATKVIPEEIVPVEIIGRMTLNRNPDNFFAETEQAAFCPANVVPGIEFSDDPLLQGRLFSYLDTQLKRLGSTNFHQLPINAPKCPVMNFQRDGHMQMGVPTGRANYEPNSLHQAGEGTGPRECPATGFATHPAIGAGNAEDSGTAEKVRLRAELFADHYSQARMFWRSQTDVERTHIVAAFTFELSKVVLEHVRLRVLGRLANVDAELVARVAAGLGMDVPEALPVAREPFDLDPSPALSIQTRYDPQLKGRKVAILFADGSDGAAIAKLQEAIRSKGATPFLVAPKVGGLATTDGVMPADGQLAGSPSVLFDAVALVLSDEGARQLMGEAAALQFVMDAYVHCKAIGASDGAMALLEKAGVMPDPGVAGVGEDFMGIAGQRFWDREAKVRLTT
jgi:catalase